MGTQFSAIYNRFFSKVTDDMYMELDKTQTEGMVGELFESALPWFEFPRVDLYNFDKENQTYNIELSNEEINIIAIYMLVEWLTQQLVSVDKDELIRALQYDRGQYEKGYEDGKRDSVRHGAWEMLPPPKKYESGTYCRFRCSECDVIFDHSSRYCSACGARMDGKESGE